MHNSQGVDLHDVEAYWKSRHVVDDRHLPYYVRWLQRFLAGPGGDSRLSAEDAQRAFVDGLGQRGDVPEWQVRQAARAVDLYQKHYLRHRIETNASQGSAEGVSAAAAVPVTIEAALAETRRLIRMRHYAYYRTEQTYMAWLSQYCNFIGRCGLPWDAPDSARAFLAQLALQRGVAASTQNQAFSAVLFLLREVLGRDTVCLNSVRAKRGPHLPVVMSEQEVAKVLGFVEGTAGLMLRLAYGGGLRVSECTSLRVKDLDFDQGLIFVRDGKGDKDRATLLPSCLHAALKVHLARVKTLHDEELAQGHGDVELPYALATKYPKAAWQLAWQYVFPARGRSVDPRSGAVRRHHVDEQVLRRIMRDAVDRAEITKHVGPHTLRHSFATHLLMRGVNIREVQEYMGHKSVETTMIYTHVMRSLNSTAISPLDAMGKTR